MTSTPSPSSPDDADADALVNPASPTDDAQALSKPGDRQAGGEPVDAAEDDPS